MLSEKYPALTVEGENFPPPPARAFCAQLLSFVKLAVIAMIVMGRDPFPHLNIPTPSMFAWALQNKVCFQIRFVFRFYIIFW